MRSAMINNASFRSAAERGGCGRSWTIFTATLALLVVVPIFSASVRAEIFAGANVPTQRQFDDKERAFRTKTMIEAYQAHKDNKQGWDKDAVKFLTDYVKMGRHNGQAPGAVELEREGRLLYMQNCQDPLVLYAYGQTLIAKGWNTQAEWFMRRSAETMVTHGYAPTWRAAAADVAVQIMVGHYDRDGAKPYAEMVAGAILEMLKSPLYAKEDRALLLAHIDADCRSLASAQLKTVWETAAKIPDADPMAVLYLEGEYHKNTAWESRGGGWANNVTQDGWKGFESHLNAATTAFTKAWEIDHTIPEPPTAMISVAMGGAGPAEMRTWFDRAVHARFDYEPAYSAYIYGLYPRWHGDRQALLDFGLECLHTRRFDTNVPIHFLDVLLAVREECDNGDMTGWARPEVYEPAKELLDKSLAADGCLPCDRHYQSLEAAFCVQAGRCDDALKVIKSMHGDLLMSGTKHANVTPMEVLGAAYAFGDGDASAAPLKASGLAADGKRKQAIDAYEAALKDQKQPAAAQFLQGIVQTLRWEDELRDGKEVSLKADKLLSGFHVGFGNWLAQDDGSLRAMASATQHLDLVCLADFGEHWELRATVDFIKRQADWSATGFTLAIPGSTRYTDYTVNAAKGFASRGAMHQGETEGSGAAKDRGNELILRRDGLQVVAKLNGKEVLRGTAPADTDARRLRIGFGGWPIANGDVVQFRDVRIKQTAAK